VDLKHRKADTLAPTEKEFVMAMAARKIEAEFQMQESTVLENKVDRVQEDVGDLKADVKVLQSDVAVIKADVKLLQTEVDHLKANTKRIDAKVDAIGVSLTEHRIETEKSFAKLRVEIKDALEKYRDRHFVQIGWMISTVIAAIGAAFTAMKFFAAA
jgi:chromosome segregation ATPase